MIEKKRIIKEIDNNNIRAIQYFIDNDYIDNYFYFLLYLLDHDKNMTYLKSLLLKSFFLKEPKQIEIDVIFRKIITINDYNTIELILKKPKVNPSTEGNFSLRHASARGYTEIIKLLINDTRTYIENSVPILNAAREGELEIVTMFLDSPKFHKVLNDKAILTNACFSKNFELVKLLIEKYCFIPNIKDLQCALSSRNMNTIEFILNDKRVDPSEDNNKVIALAAKYGFLKFVKILLNDNRVDPSDNKNKAILAAHSKQEKAIVKLLWDNKKVKNKLKNDQKDIYNIIKTEITVEGF
jgi:hypothetical protein